ncbi:cytochrome b562 family protein [Vibrio sp. 404]|uniref:Cytochrome b562 family protein n=1 Tax=Vibrio marinisediminis TaxID=2758441 RepID=A0A7W2FTK5_9VIBR|nr:cytochrome b562 [Vibrio marinisediminis]MBA5764013.1 cytochrome b562 family protein [Vibrio marinisediminis]
MIRSVLILTTLVTTQVIASDYDLKSAMKQMKLDFKHAAEAQTVEEMQQAMVNFNQLLDASKQAQYPDEKKALYMEGFEKLTITINGINQELEQGDLQGAKQQLKVIDDLREEYHDKRNPSIWSKLFG